MFLDRIFPILEIGGAVASRPKQKLIKLLQMMKDSLTRAEIAEREGVSLRTVYNWERKARETLGTATTIEAICLACKSGWLRKDPEEDRKDDFQFNRVRRSIFDLEKGDEDIDFTLNDLFHW